VRLRVHETEEILRKPTVLHSFDDFIDWWFPPPAPDDPRKQYGWESIEKRRNHWLAGQRSLPEPKSYPCLAFETPPTREDIEYNDGPLHPANRWNFWTVKEVRAARQIALDRAADMDRFLAEMQPE